MARFFAKHLFAASVIVSSAILGATAVKLQPGVPTYSGTIGLEDSVHIPSSPYDRGGALLPPPYLNYSSDLSEKPAARRFRNRRERQTDSDEEDPFEADVASESGGSDAELPGPLRVDSLIPKIAHNTSSFHSTQPPESSGSSSDSSDSSFSDESSDESCSDGSSSSGSEFLGRPRRFLDVKKGKGKGSQGYSAEQGAPPLRRGKGCGKGKSKGKGKSQESPDSEKSEAPAESRGAPEGGRRMLKVNLAAFGKILKDAVRN